MPLLPREALLEASTVLYWLSAICRVLEGSKCSGRALVVFLLEVYRISGYRCLAIVQEPHLCLILQEHT